MTPLRTTEAISSQTSGILATEEEAAAGLVNNKLMTPLRTAEAIAELAQGGVILNETVIVADYSLGLEDVGSVRLVGDSDPVEVVYEIEDLVTFNVNFYPAEMTMDYVGY